MAVIRPANNIRLPTITLSGSSAEPLTGLTFLENASPNSDIRLVWSGDNLLPRTAHTFLWKSLYLQQTGYYATTWHAHNDGSFHADSYEYGCHPFPCDGEFDSGTGQATGGTGGSGTVHYHEQAGFAGVDCISSPSGANGGAHLVTKGVWRWYARQCFISGANIVHRYYRNLENDLTDYIETTRLLSALTTPSAPAFYFGCSDWRVGLPFDATGNDESPYGHHRSFAAFSSGALTASECQQELASDSNSAQTAAGIASVWYINKNPTPDDVSDKSGAGHSPSWANARRPTLWEP